MEWYRPILALHVIAIISLMAGILYLYRLLIYASEQGTADAKIHALLSLMSRRLYRIITVPAMSVAWVAGVTMIGLNPGIMAFGWLHIKLACVLAMTGMTLYAGVLVRRYEAGAEPLPLGKALRFLNEVPTLLMIVVVVMVIVRPWQ